MSSVRFYGQISMFLGSNLPVLLSFAVGGLLGDVFLHLLPEAWNQIRQGKVQSRSLFYINQPLFSHVI